METPDYLRELITYIHANPVRAGIVVSMTDWPWSSCRELISGAASQLVNRQELLDLAELDMEGLRDLLAQPVEKRERTPLWELANDAASIWGIDPRQIREGGKRATAYCTKARIRLIEEALDAGYSRAEISRFLNCSRAAVSKLGRKC